MTSDQNCQRELFLDLILEAARVVQDSKAEPLSAPKEAFGGITQQGDLYAETILFLMERLAIGFANLQTKNEAKQSLSPKAPQKLDLLINRMISSLHVDLTDSLAIVSSFINLYESSLELRLVDSMSKIVKASRPKKRHGQFYTPLPLAKKVVATALGKLLSEGEYRSSGDLLNLKILDPAMGAGIFLICTIDFLEKWSAKFLKSAPPRSELSKCVYGIDIDSSAWQVACLALWLYCQGQPLGENKNKNLAPNLVKYECANK